ncbi:MAG: hypothetical protein ACR2LA_11335 [Acidimicrobiales bacterium]
MQGHLDDLEAVRITLRCPQTNGRGGRCSRRIALLLPEGSNGAVVPAHYGPQNMDTAEWPITDGVCLSVERHSRMPMCAVDGCWGVTKGEFCPAHASGKDWKDYEPRVLAGWGHRVRIWCPGRKCKYERTVRMSRLSQLFVVAATVGSPDMWVP